MTACSAYRIFPVEVFRPAEVALEGEKRVGFLDRNIRYEAELLVHGEETVIADFCKGLHETLVQENGQDTFPSFTVEQRTYRDRLAFPEALAPGERAALMERYRIDYLISLEMTGVTLENDEGVLTLFLRFYAAGHAHAIDSALYKLYPEDAGIDAGRAYAWRLLPGWTVTQRRIYNKGRALRLGDYYYLDDRQDTAFDIWTAARKPPRQAIRSSINVAWLYESAGQLDEALWVLREAEAIAQEEQMTNPDTVYLKAYIAMIEKRIADAALLDQQTIPGM